MKDTLESFMSALAVFSLIFLIIGILAGCIQSCHPELQSVSVKSVAIDGHDYFIIMRGDEVLDTVHSKECKACSE